VASPAPPAPAPVPEPPPAPAPVALPETAPDEEPLAGPGLDLKSTPAGATFFVNGKKVGKAPLQVAQRKGKLRVLATKPGYKRWFRVMWHKEDLTKVHARMDRK
jgi:hypothetical protein